MLQVLTLVVLSGAEFLGPPISVRPAPPQVEAQIPIDGAHVGLVAVDGGYYATWADARRTEGLSPTPLSNPSKDIWIRRLFDLDVLPVLLCPSPTSAIAPDLLYATDQLTVAYRTGAGQMLHARYHPASQSWDSAGACGRPVVDGGIVLTGGPTLVSDGTREVALWWTSSELTVWDLRQNLPINHSPRLFGLTHPAAVLRQNLFIAARNSLDGSVQLVDNGARSGVLGSALAHAVAGPRPLIVFTVLPQAISAYDPDGGLSVPTSIPNGLSAFAPQVFASLMGDKPVAVVAVTLDGGRSAAWSPQTAPFDLRVSPHLGTPVAFASSGTEGVVLMRAATSGDLQATRLVLDGGGLLLWSPSIAQRVSTASVMQRRPSVAWLGDGWLLASEEGRGTGWSIVTAPVASDAGGAVLSVPFGSSDPTGVPLLVRHWDGGVDIVNGPVARRWQPPPFDQMLLDSPVGAVSGPNDVFYWSTTRQWLASSISPSTSLSGIECAAWFNGQFHAARASSSWTLESFTNPSTPLSSQLAGPSCVTAYPMDAPRHLVVATIQGNRIDVVWHRSLGPGFQTRMLPTGSSPRDVRLAPLPDGVLVTWSEDSGLWFTVVDETPQVTRVPSRLSTVGRDRRGRVALASSPGGVLLMWPVLEDDSVVLEGRVVTYQASPTGTDGGVDAGAADAGAADGGVADAGAADAGLTDAGTADAGSTDAGTSDGGTSDGGTSDGGSLDAGGVGDAGSTDGGLDGGNSDAGGPDAGPEPMVFVPSCGCSSDGLSSAAFAFVLFVIRGRRSTAR